MKKVLITKEFEWDCAHKLISKNLSEDENKEIFGPCNNIHGHRYKLLITVSGKNNELKNGMVINFTDLKVIVNELIVKRFDHKYLNTDELYLNDKETTCENQVYDIWDILEEPLLEKGIILEKVKLYETPTSFASIQNED